jgi:hypothetical protein
MHILNEMKMVDSLIQNPNRASIGSVTSFILGFLPNFDKTTQDQITFWFQIAAFTVSIVVGIFAIHGYICKLSHKPKKE